MKEHIKTIYVDRMLFLTLLASLFLLFLQLSIIVIKLTTLPPLVPLLFQQPWGQRQLVGRELIFILPLVSALFVACNIAAALSMYRKMPLLSRMFFWGSLFIVLLSTISSIRIVLLVS